MGTHEQKIPEGSECEVCRKAVAVAVVLRFGVPTRECDGCLGAVVSEAPTCPALPSRAIEARV